MNTTDILKTLEKYEGLTKEEIAGVVGYSLGIKRPKALNRILVARLLSLLGVEREDLSRAGLELKTIRLGMDGNPKEHMSFPAFDYIELAGQSWATSDFHNMLRTTFLFAVFVEEEGGCERLHKVGTWLMPPEDLEEARLVWEDTRARILSGSTDFCGINSNPVAHVRPHARNGADKTPFPSGKLWIRSSFWLNSSYVRSIVGDL